MKLRIGVGLVAIAALTAACKKSSDGGAGAGTASGSAAASSGSGSAGASAGSGAATGSSAGSGAAAGSSAGTGPATGSGTGSSAAGATGSGSATGDGAAAGYNKAAFLEDPLCIQVANKIRECAAKPAFIAALDDGATAQQKKVNARLRRGVKKWQPSFELCHNAWDLLNYEYMGFLDKPSVFKAPNALSSCAELGAAVKAGGGLVGGKTGE